MRRLGCGHPILIGLIAAWGPLLPPATGAEIAPQRHVVGAKAPGAFVPYTASHSLTEPNERITRLLFAIHSSDCDARQYYENARAAAAKVDGALPATLIVAPQFFDRKMLSDEIPDGLLYWPDGPFRGSSRAAVGTDAQRVRISAYEILDDWLRSLTGGGLFPRLKDIVIVGHSAGGQFVQRYALVGKFEAPGNIKCRYVVSAPSSYAYPSGERLDQTTKSFVIPHADTLAACPDYNQWGYGLDAPYDYFSDASADALAARYAERTVFYLCGENDNDPNHSALGRSCAAMMQGRHRLERMRVFAECLKHKYGPSIVRRHRFAVVPGVGHDGKATMTSARGVEFMFSTIP